MGLGAAAGKRRTALAGGSGLRRVDRRSQLYWVPCIKKRLHSQERRWEGGIDLISFSISC